MFTVKPYAFPALVFGSLLAASANIQAATLTVTTTQDRYDGTCDSHCSLRDAVAAANRQSGADRIALPAGTFVLSRQNPLDDEEDLPLEEDRNRRGDLDVRDRLTISGTSMAGTVINGAINDRLIEVRPGVQLILERLTLQGGDSVKNGGAVENHGTLELREVLVQNNQVNPWEPDEWGPGDRFHDGRGGGIANYGTLTVRLSLFKFNSAGGLEFDYRSGYGGAIYSKGSLLVQDSLFQDNSTANQQSYGGGSAIYSTGQATIERSTVLDHLSSPWEEGGAITNQGGVLHLLNSTLSGNTISVTNGYLDEMPEQSKALLSNVTITGSSCDDFFLCLGAVTNGGDLQIRNSMIVGNKYAFEGEETPKNCANVGRYYRYQATGLLINDEPGNCTGDYYVPFSDTYTQVIAEQLHNESDRVGVHPLLPGSPAVDVGIGDCLAQDQRGIARPQDGNSDGLAVCDLGAYELTP